MASPWQQVQGALGLTLGLIERSVPRPGARTICRGVIPLELASWIVLGWWQAWVDKLTTLILFIYLALFISVVCRVVR
jgi:hypothetical protein